MERRKPRAADRKRTNRGHNMIKQADVLERYRTDLWRKPPEDTDKLKETQREALNNRHAGRSRQMDR